MNPLPPILLEEVKQEFKKKFILCITRDFSKEDKSLFKNHDLLEYEDDIHKNIPIDSYKWDVLVLDLRKKTDRYCYMKNVKPKKEQYNVICFCFKFEEDDIDIECDNVLSSFPVKQARIEDFELLLLQKRIIKPRWWKSLFSSCLGFYHQIKN
jgi:hypothetical protein